jgi:type IX secretion system PorP/SprF family membrane protein
MKQLFILTTTLFLGWQIKAQDHISLSHYLIAPELINPGAIGFDGQQHFRANARASWIGIPNAPQAAVVQYSGAIGSNFGMGLGLFNQTAANLNQIRARLNFAFKFKVSDNVAFSAGLSTDYMQSTLNNRVLENNFYDLNDPIGNQFINGKRLLDATLGLYGRFYDKTFVGVAFTNLVMARLDEIESGINEGMSFRYYLVHAGHRFDFPYSNFSIEPSILVRQIQNVPFQIDMNVKAGFMDEKLVTGFSYRSLGTTGLLLGTKWSFFELYYSYDISLQKFQNYNAGSHEVTFGLSF